MAGNSPLLAAVYARRCSPRVLIVGDGDFSFARALAKVRARRKGLFGLCNAIGAVKEASGSMSIAAARRAQRDSAPFLCATSYDTQEDLERKYGAGAIGTTLGDLAAEPEVRVVHGVDATNVDASVLGDGYDLILFNFPKVNATTREEFRIAGRVPRNRYLIPGSCCRPRAF